MVVSLDSRPFVWALIALSVPALAVAQEHMKQSARKAISLDPGASCLQPVPLAAAVEQFLPDDSIDSRIRVHVSGHPTIPDRVSFTVLREGQTVAMRRFENTPRDCQHLHALVGLAVAFAIDATWLTRRVVEEEADNPSAPSPLALGVELLVSGGVVPGLGLGSAIRLELAASEWLDLRATTLGVFSWNQSIGESSGKVDALLAAGRLDACGGGRLLRHLRIRACTGAAVGPFITHGREFEDSKTQTKPWIASSTGVDCQLSLTPGASLVLTLVGFFPVSRRVIQVLGPDGEVMAERRLEQASVVVGIGPTFLLR